MRISDWSSDVCSSDLATADPASDAEHRAAPSRRWSCDCGSRSPVRRCAGWPSMRSRAANAAWSTPARHREPAEANAARLQDRRHAGSTRLKYRSEEHTSELQSLMRISYAVFCLKKKTRKKKTPTHKH